ncbi:MAG TPA: LPS assembly protein LptD [Deltaproteobacteria bacterium]|nr:LPS assembly protein LptD [Deltaproteobacteria bacterium]
MQRLAFLTTVMIVLLARAASGVTLDVEADRLQREGSRIEASGNVVVKGDDLVLKADYIIYDTESGDIWATGECILSDADSEVMASSISYNTLRKDVHILDGSFRSNDGTMRISGASITRYGLDYIQGRDVEYTPCLGDPPDWSLRVRELDIPVGGYGAGSDVHFMVRRWPLVRLPYLFFPAKLYRHSGLLFPEFSHGSDYGYRFGQPVYVVLGRSVDATVTPTWLTDRGLLAKNEVRYSLDQDRTGMIYLEALKDRKGGDPSEGGVIDTVPSSRWFVRAQQTGEDLNWDINLASTADYFRDIGAFTNTDPMQGQGFSRDLNVLDDSRLEELISRGQWVDSRWGMSFAVSGQFKQDLTREDNGQTIQQLPRLTARLRQRPIPFIPLTTSAEFSTVRISTTDWIEAFKDNADIDVSLPLSIYPYVTFRPFFKEFYRDTRFSQTQDQYSDSSYAEHWSERGASLITTLYSGRFLNSLEHQMVPGITWTYRSRYGGNYDPLDEEDLFPQILPDDDWRKTSEIEASLANYIRDRSGMSLADLTVGSVYNCIEEGWREIRIETNLRPAPWITASHRNVLDREDKGPYATTEHTTRVTLTDARGDAFSLGGEYNRLDTKLLVADMRVDFGLGLSAGLDTRYDYLEHEFITQTQDIAFTSQCWSVRVERKAEAADEDTPSNTTWSVNVRLLGMGDILQPRRPVAEGGGQ